METLQINLHQIISLAGLAQIGLAAGSTTIPKILNWTTELNKVQPLIKKIFWTYAAYILTINLCFGLVSFGATDDLLSGSRLALLLTGFMAVYWISRVLTQFLYFDRSSFPKSKWHTLGEVVLVCLFIFLSTVYSWAAITNFKQV